MTENVGYFNSEEAKKLVEIVSKFKIGLKEHNCDNCDTLFSLALLQRDY